MLDWRIYYGDGSTYDSEDGPAESAPGYNLQCIVWADEKMGKMLLRGGDFYLYRHGSWLSVDTFGLLDQLQDMGILERREGKYSLWGEEVNQLDFYFKLIDAGIVKTGRNIPRQEFEAIQARALHDKDFPRQSARSQYGAPYDEPGQVQSQSI